MEKNNIHNRVEQALENIRPYLQKDGGDVKLVSISDTNVVNLELVGNCHECPMADMTIQSGIADSIKRMAPEVTGIKTVNM